MFETKQTRREQVQEQASALAAVAQAAAADGVGALRDQAAPLASDAAEAARERVTAAREALTPAAHDAADAARERFAAAREAAAPVLQDAAETAKERLAAAREAAAPVVHDVVDRARPKVEAAQSTFVEKVLPRLAALLATGATALTQARAAAEQVAVPAAAHARDTALESAHVGNERARDALKVLEGEAVIKPRRRGRGRWLIGVGLLAAGVAAVAAFRKQQQANDPWATPLTDPLGEPSLKDKAADKLGHAKDVVADAAATATDKAKEKASDLAAKGQAAVADAKDRSGEDPTLASELDDPDGPVGLGDGGGEGGLDAVDGQVTEVDRLPDSDAIESVHDASNPTERY